ncbi:MAG: hypothetical protein QXQ81_03040 [Candidatus Thorarchaeota archaeon]
MSESEPGLATERAVVFRDLTEIDPALHAVTGLYRYPARFIPHVVLYVLKNYARPSDRVFDPFAGTGTVGFVSRVQGHDYELWDLNPMVDVIHRVVLESDTELDVEAVIRTLRSHEDEFTPTWSGHTYWFDERILPVLYRAWGFYHSIESPSVQLALTLPLLRVSRLYSYDDRARMKLSSSRRSRERVGRLLLGDWMKDFYSTLSRTVKDQCRKIRLYRALCGHDVDSSIMGGVDTLSTDLRTEADILITSPPYLQSQEYMRYSKLDLAWLGHDESDMARLRGMEVPYRQAPPVRIGSSTFELFRAMFEHDSVLKTYDAYFNAIVGSLARLSKRVRSRMAIFVGRSSMRGQPVPIDRVLVEHFSSMGWRHEATLVDRIAARTLFPYGLNPSTKIPDQRTTAERLVVLTRE